MLLSYNAVGDIAANIHVFNIVSKKTFYNIKYLFVSISNGKNDLL